MSTIPNEPFCASKGRDKYRVQIQMTLKLMMSAKTFLGLFTLPDRDSDPGMNVRPKNDTVAIGDRSLSNLNMICRVQCSHWVLTLNPSRHLNRVQQYKYAIRLTNNN